MAFPRTRVVTFLLAVVLAPLSPACKCGTNPFGGDTDAGGGNNTMGDGGNNTTGDGGNNTTGDGGNTDAGNNTGCGLLTCQSVGASCGPVSDGCDGVLQCGSCAAPQTCGGGGSPSQCGGMQGCVPITCTAMSANCGPMSDGCGNLLNCGACLGTQTCGGGGVSNTCGTAGCSPRTCAGLGANCGPVGDGCGGLLNCGTCTAPLTCGGGGAANVCGGGTTADGGAICTPRTCMAANATCGTIGDGCGGTLFCGDCTGQTLCGAAGTANQCGVPTCVELTCMTGGFNCGLNGNGCGGTIMCGSCTAPEVCGGGGPGVCGTGTVRSDGGVFVQCDAGSTSIRGTVVAGTDPARGFGQPDPIYGATVFIPSGPIQPIVTGATCDNCNDPQPALVSAVTGIDGTFVLNNPPVGANIPVVIQLGKWRRVVNITVTACGVTQMTQEQTRLPRNRNEGNIPRFAVATGNVDTLHCVLRKMGIEDSEFVNPTLVANLPTNPGRVHIFHGNPVNAGNGGAVINGQTPDEDALWGNQATINSYDIVLFPCVGGRDDKNAADQQRIVNYTNLGGRIFTTHFSYTWLRDINPFSTTAAWNVGQGNYDTMTGFIDQGFPKGIALAEWLDLVNASTIAGRIPVDVVRHDFDSVVAPSQRWMYSQAPEDAFPLHYTFNTPVGTPAAQQCGRVVFSDFHVEDASDTNNVVFPAECNANAPMTPQEKLLEFMLFDLSSCISQDFPTCAPQSCEQQGFSCGQQGDGCGAGPLDCGMCPPGFICGGGGPGVCGTGCIQRTCQQLGAGCGPQSDGCGGIIQCGDCPAGQTCGGGWVQNQCGGTCTPRSCQDQGFTCGPAGDGCGNTIQCGMCASPLTCGGANVPGQCGLPPDGGACRPRTCQEQSLSCGPAGDGCGGTIQCGDCPMGQTCGGGGVNGQCGVTNCTKRTCMQANADCGTIGDGCGGTVECGTCPSGLYCGGLGAGTPNVCGPPPG